ncbi:hypothetical protein [Nonomuraea sp. GTA35]|uniref:hypothetical protein n=1 Tax=Nonomuraea sp. GTA35 TaxID=1676746 RepID=UPI0035C253A8
MSAINLAALGVLALSVVALAVSVWAYRDIKRNAQQAIKDWGRAEASWNEAGRLWTQAAANYREAEKIRRNQP